MGKYDERRWTVPSKRAKSYAEERKAKVHQHGPKEGKELTDYEAGMRSGYLQCQSDHAGTYKYKKALAEGKSKAEASPRRKPSAFPDRKAKPKSKIGRI